MANTVTFHIGEHPYITCDIEYPGTMMNVSFEIRLEDAEARILDGFTPKIDESNLAKTICKLTDLEVYRLLRNRIEVLV